MCKPDEVKSRAILRQRMVELLAELDSAGETLAAARLSSAIDALED